LQQMSAETHSNSPRWKLNDCARIAQGFWRQSAGDDLNSDDAEKLSARIESAMRLSHGGRNLCDLGYHNDIRLCSAVDCIDRVPMLNRVSGDLSLEKGSGTNSAEHPLGHLAIGS
ncbi:MAG: hypothetical protein WKF77_09225, partial [Planctomycetaceae bacterium]